MEVWTISRPAGRYIDPIELDNPSIAILDAGDVTVPPDIAACHCRRHILLVANVIWASVLSDQTDKRHHAFRRKREGDGDAVRSGPRRKRSARKKRDLPVSRPGQHPQAARYPGLRLDM
jgi:hypothetical protein